MKNLMTRKLLFGMLMVLVLAFSVQGIADALTFRDHSSSDGDLRTASETQEFTVKFSVSLKSNTTIKDVNGNLIDEDDNRIDSAGYFVELTDHDDNVDTPDRLVRTPVGAADQTDSAKRYHYNQEQVTVTVTGGANITKVGNNTIPAGATKVLMETGVDDARLSSSITLTLSAATAAEITITIEDTTPTDDLPNGTADQDADLKFTVFVVDDRAPDTDDAEWGFSGLTENYRNGGTDFTDEAITNASTSADVRVEYSVIEGPGRLYVQKVRDNITYRGSAATTLSTSSAAEVRLDMNSGTSKVRASISGVAPVTGIFIFGYPDVAITGGNNQEGVTNGRLEQPLVVRITDGKGKAISGLAADFGPAASGTMFIPVLGTVVYVDNQGVLVDAFTDADDTETATSSRPEPGADILVQTDSRGEAKTYFQLGTSDANFNVSAGGSSIVGDLFRQTIVTTAGIPSIEIFSGNNQRADSSGNVEDELVVKVTNRGNRLSGTPVTFTANRGILTNTVPPGDAESNVTVEDVTDGQGLASVTYFFDHSGAAEVVATIVGSTPTTYRREVTFGINGGRGTTTTTPRTPTTRPTITLTPSSISGDAGTTRLIRATATDQNDNPVSDVLVTFSLGTASSTSFLDATVRTDSFGRADATLTLPSSSDTVFARATVDGLDVVDSTGVTVTSTAPETVPEVAVVTSGAPSRLIVFSGDDQIGDVNRRLDDDLIVRVLDSNGRGVESEVVRFRITDGRGRLSPASSRTDDDGFASTTFTPRADGTIEVEAVSGNLSPVIFTITTGEPPDAIVLVSGNNQSGRPGAALANSFIVEVIDENDDVVSGVTVTFAVTAGGGTLSATSATTNASGRAQTTLTLGDAPGDNTVAARVTGLTGVTFKATSGSQVLVRSVQRAPMYWISRTNGKLHRLVDDEIENLAPNVTGVTSLAVDSANGLLYFGVKTGENRGAVRRSNLNGRSVQTLKTLTSVPTGIAIDSAGGSVYWTNSRGRIQSIPTEGSAKITNILQNLPNPMALVLSNGHLYWGEPLGRLRRVSLTDAQKIVQNIATGLGEPLSLSIAKGKLYWTERGAGGSGKLQRSNLDGSSIQQLKTFASGVPIGIAVDSADNKIYWTKGVGKIQRANLAGKFVRDIATGIMNPGSIALGTEAVADAPVVRQPTTTPTTTPKADNSKYDVNGDGAVDNIDVTLVAVSLGSSNAKYDVNGDGTVDANDLRAVIANADDAAAAPVIDVDFTALNVDMIQEQIDMLLASGDTSLAGQRTLAYLQHILASARPDETVLLANYPNPFNPETWIPYHLATGTDVQVNIYNTQGTLVRMLTLGHQSAGYYTSRSRAAYWDGRNAFGERVASGIYFYQLQTDKISPMRKMVILK